MLTVLSKVWDAVSGGLSDRLLGRILGPAFYFWVLGGVAYAWNRKLDPEDIFERIKAVPLEDGVLYAFVGGLVLIASNALMEALQFAILRGLEGYWPERLRMLLNWRINQVRSRVLADRAEWARLATRYGSHTDEERQRYRRLDRELAYYPESSHQLKPTMVGNVLSAAESYAWDRYGLASVLMWPRLWLVMDDGSRNEVTSARDRLNMTVQLLAWRLS